MVTRRFLAVLVLLIAAMVGAATPALALGGTDSNGPSGGSGGGNQTQGSDNGSAFGTARSCALYATSTSFGMSCASDDGGPQPPKLNDELHGQDPPVCWDAYLTPEIAFAKYGVNTIPDTTYNTYLHTCVTGLDVKAPLSQQPGLNVHQTLIDIDKTKNAPCPDADVTHPSASEIAGVNMTCVLTVKDPQTVVSDFVANEATGIPAVTIVEHPAIDHVRTQVDTTFTDSVPCPGCTNDDTKTPVEDHGGVQMWAQMDGLNDAEPFKILPMGPNNKDTDPWNGPDQQECAGTVDITAKDRCHYTYHQSSLTQPGHYYPFRAVATWRVFYDDGTGRKQLAVFHKYDDVRLPVSDVQALVVPH